MTLHYFVLEDPKDFPWGGLGRRILSAKDYLQTAPRIPKRARIVNLCRDYQYLGLGYYVSLLAEARQDRIIPAVESMLDIGWKRIYARALPELNAELDRLSKKHKDMGDTLDLLVCFGQAEEARFQDFAEHLFDAFRCPILKVHAARTTDGWQIEDVDVKALKRLSEPQRELFVRALDRYTKRAPRQHKNSRPPKYTLAVLHDPKEALPPSNRKAFDKLEKVAAPLGMKVELITRKDFRRLSEFDALFIRETTALDHYTYRFARRAEAEGMPVLDDPTSILRCTNKVYLAELMAAANLPRPKTAIVDAKTLMGAGEKVGYPVVLKIPDGSFSRGVKKAANPEELKAVGEAMLKESDLILAQEYLPTEFDWRVGILNGTPLFVCRYFMAHGHWQIVKHETDGRYDEGLFETLSVADAPGEVLDMALAAARPIGNGLYGVDIKETPMGPRVIEVNDNPNLDAGVEDKVLKDDLWRIIAMDFIRRIEAR